MTLYETLEDKWYATVDYLDQYIPIGNVVDKIDEKIPSFMIFLAIIFIIILLLILPILSRIELPGIGVTEKEFLVLSSDNLPLKDVTLFIDSECSDGTISITTDSSGKATSKICNKTVYIEASKNGYQTYQEEIELNENRHIIKLSQKQITFQREILLEINDEKNNLLNEAEAEIICDNNSFVLKNQPSEGWTFNVTNCGSLKINASSTNYKPKTINLLASETRKTINLERLDLTGKIYFETTYNETGEKAEIIITNEFNESQIYTTNDFGTTSADLEEGTYNYIATNLSGEQQEDSFTVNAGDNKIVEIKFNTSGKAISEDNKKYLALEIVDEQEQAIISAVVDFYRDDGNKIGLNRTYQNGKTTPRAVVSGNYKAVIDAQGYQKTVIDVEIKNNNEYQKVILKKGGNKLKISAVDDINNVEAAATVQLYYGGFKGVFSQGFTDSNGELLIDYLPAGNYEVFAIDKEKKDETRVGFLISGNEIMTNINLVLVTGIGKLNYKFYNSEKKAINPNILVYEDDEEKLKTFEGIIQRGAYSTTELKKGTKVIIESNDNNILSYTSIPFEVTRGNSQKEIFLKSEAELPNQNTVQIILDQIYEANPLYSNMARGSTKIVDGKTYWLYFSTIVNNENEGALISNFYVDENATIEGIYSIEGSNSVLSKLNEGNIIEEVENENLVDENAIQANLKIKNIKGKKVVPIILEIKTDENTNSFNLYYNAIHNNEESLNYNREFIIGESFCINDCPTFFFDNYLNWTSNNFNKIVPLVEAKTDILIGDEYELKTIVKNLSDIDFKESNLINEIPKNSFDNLSFLNDKNNEKHNINLRPISSSIEKTSPLRQKNIGSAQINQTISSNFYETQNLEGYQNKLNFAIRNKLQLKIEISPNTINTGRVYPFFLVKTRYTNSNKGSPATWYAEIDGRRILDGVTDENGISLISFNTTSIEPGDIIKFTAKDDAGSVDAILEVEAKDAFNEIIEDDPCLSVEINDDTYDYYLNSNINLNKNQQTNIKIKSICEEERRFYIHSDITTNIKTGNIEPNSEIEITLTATPRESLIGVYPVQIITINGSRYSQIALIDMIIKDPNSCFDMTNYIFDLEVLDSQVSNIINNCYSGRKDNFYPKMDISTNSVGLSYEKPGIPEVINFKAKVTGHAIEGFVNGQVKSDVIYIRETGGEDDDPYNIPTVAYDGALEYTMDAAQKYCESLAYTGDYIEKPEPELIEEPFVDYDVYDPSTLLPVEGPASNIVQDPEPVVEVKSKEKENRVSFELENTGPKSTIGTGKDVILGETGELSLGVLPEDYGEYEKWNGEINNKFGGEGGTSKLWGGVRNIGVGPYHLNDYVQEYTWTFLMDLYGNPTPGAPYPSGFNSTENWRGVHEDGPKAYEVLEENSDKEAKILSLNYLGDGLFQGSFKVKGDKDVHPFNVEWKTSKLKVQVDHARILDWLIERVAEWEQDVNIIPIEGRVYKIGSYVRDATPVPEWTDEEPLIHGYELGESWSINGAKSVYTAVCSYPQGFVNPERSLGGEEPNEVLDPIDPLVEYDPSGIIMYKIDPQSVPQDLEVFLRDGSYFARYVGTPTVDDEVIDFTISKNNLLGSEYAIIDIYDWAGDTANDYVDVEIVPPTARKFLWKPKSESDGKLVILHSPRVIGDVSIYGPDGTLLEVGDSRGASNGYEDTVRFDKEGSEYPDGSYVNFGPYSCLIPESSGRVESCVARSYKETRSNAEIKKQSFQIKLKSAETTCVSSEGDIGFTGREFVPRLLFNWDWDKIQSNQCDSTNSNYTYCDGTQFLISLFKKLNEIENLLNRNRLNEVAKETAFYSYLIRDNYNQNLLDDFKEYYTTNLTNTNPVFNEKFKYFIENDLIEINSDMNYGGIYRVEINIEDLTEGINSMFDGNTPIKKIEINLIPIKRESNYSPFYELPINGSVGEENRDGYGIVTQNELRINNNVITPVSGNGFISVNNTTSNNLNELSSGIVLKYNKNGIFEFNPSQITPVAWEINSTTGNVSAGYIINNSQNNIENTKWKLYSSTIGKKTCEDFEGSTIYNFDTISEGNKYGLNFNGTKSGTIVLGTNFFTPKQTNANTLLSIIDSEGITNIEDNSQEYDAYGKVANFPGAIGDYISLPNSSSLSNFPNGLTIEALIYQTGEHSPSGENPYAASSIVHKGEFGAYIDYGFAVANGGRLMFTAGSNSTAFSCSSVVKKNEWVHVAVSVDKLSQKIRMYVNGVETSVCTAGFNYNFSSRGPSPMIGRGYPISWEQAGGWGGYHDQFIGKMDNVKIWNKALNKSQIDKSMNEEINLIGFNPVGYWSFDNGTSDLSGNGNNGVLRGNVNLVNRENFVINKNISSKSENSTSKFYGDNLTQIGNTNGVLLNYYDAKQKSNYDTLSGVFDMVRNGEMCISGNSDEVKIFYNPGYLDNEILDILPSTANNCN